MLSDLILSDLDVIGSDQSETNPSFSTISVGETSLPSKQVSSVQIRYSALAITGNVIVIPVFHSFLSGSN